MDIPVGALPRRGQGNGGTIVAPIAEKKIAKFAMISSSEGKKY
jgi:hypothetical protein